MSGITNADRGGDGDIPIRRGPCQGQSEGVAGHDGHPLSLPEVVWALVLRFAMARARRGGWGADVGRDVASEAATRCLRLEEVDVLSPLAGEDDGSEGYRKAFSRLSTIVSSSYDAVVERHRKHKLESGDVPIVERRSSCVADGLNRVDFRLDIESAFRRMDPDEVRILQAIQEGLHLTEAARKLGISYGRAQTLQENACERLRILLKAYDPGPRSPRPQTSPPSTS